MKFRKLIPALAVVAFATVALAHHLPVALSSVFGAEVLHKILYLSDGASPGVPPYVIGTDEHEVAIVPQSSFVVKDGQGASETVTFDASQFADIAAAHLHEVEDAINAQLTIARAEVINDSIALRGVAGGATAEIRLEDGAISALASLGLTPGVVIGASDIHLSLSIPAEDDPNGTLINLPYLIIASATPGITPVAGFEIPVELDATTDLVMRATQFGALQGFVGTLNQTADGRATFETDLFPKMYPSALPDAVYFTYVVFSSDLTKIAYVSNAFTVQIGE